MESPFKNDPFAIAYQAFKNLYPDKDCEIIWQPEEMKDDKGNGYVGMTNFSDDGEITVEVSVFMKIGDAVETLAHELAHVAVGASEEHGEEWEKAFDAIHAEYDRIGNEMYGEDSGTAVEVSGGKGGLDPSRYEHITEMVNCPFCGKAGKIYKKTDKFMPDKYYPTCNTRHCVGRNRSVYFRTEEEAVEAWNSRMP